MLKKILTTLGILLLLGIVTVGAWTFISRHNKKELHTVINTPKKATPAPIPAKPTFDKTQFSLTDPMSVWAVVNKRRPLNPVSYVPNDLVVPNVPLRVPGNESMKLHKATATALEAMFTDAKTEGVNLMLSSGYRSYSFQTSLYGSYVKNSSTAEADKTSARPGYSEHQTGLAADIEPIDGKCDVEVCFETTPEGIWLKGNAYKYGFIIRYVADKTQITGYSYEPWHIRYVGADLSNELHKTGITTLEEFFGLDAAPDYSS
jgi:zinc D-Ala-D-Ala carboxypeptidase